MSSFLIILKIEKFDVKNDKLISSDDRVRYFIYIVDHEIIIIIKKCETLRRIILMLILFKVFIILLIFFEFNIVFL